MNGRSHSPQIRPPFLTPNQSPTHSILVNPACRSESGPPVALSRPQKRRHMLAAKARDHPKLIQNATTLRPVPALTALQSSPPTRHAATCRSPHHWAPTSVRINQMTQHFGTSKHAVPIRIAALRVLIEKARHLMPSKY
jgi:hypothetical protein